MILFPWVLWNGIIRGLCQRRHYVVFDHFYGFWCRSCMILVKFNQGRAAGLKPADDVYILYILSRIVCVYERTLVYCRIVRCTYVYMIDGNFSVEWFSSSYSSSSRQLSLDFSRPTSDLLISESRCPKFYIGTLNLQTLASLLKVSHFTTRQVKLKVSSR